MGEKDELGVGHEGDKEGSYEAAATMYIRSNGG